MSKKDFTDNPALQFISDAPQDTPQEAPSDPIKPATDEAENCEQAHTRPKKYNRSPKTEAMLQQKLEEIRELLPPGFDVNNIVSEQKTKRMQLLVKPSTFKALQVLAKKRNTSMNELVNEAIRKCYIDTDE